MSETYKTSQLVESVAKIVGITRKDSSAVLRCMTELIKRRVAEGYTVDLYHFGKFRIIEGTSTVNRVLKNKNKLGNKHRYKRVMFYPARGFKIPIYTGLRYRSLRRGLLKKGERHGSKRVGTDSASP